MPLLEGILFSEVISSVFYTFFALILMLACWWLIELVTPFSLRRELEEEKNTAIAIVMGAMFIALAIIIAAVLQS